MTFDDGILTIYEVTNTAEPGNKPKEGLFEKFKSYFGYLDIGVTRFYEALRANQSIEAVVNIPEWQSVSVNDVAVIGEQQYQIGFVQPTTDENGLKITKLTLGKVENAYEIP